MTCKEELIALAARVEALNKPCRETDLAIILAKGSHVLERRGSDRKEWLYPINKEGTYRLDPNPYTLARSLPRYTASLDAASELVGEAHVEFVVQDAIETMKRAGWTGPYFAALARLTAAAALRTLAESSE